MRVLLSPGESDLAGTLRDGLTGHDAVLDVDPQIDAESGVRTVGAGFDAVVWAGLPDGPADPSGALDRATRLAYDLLNAAAESGVRRCVYLSSLRLLADYPAHHTVTEGWRPLPPSDDAALLGCHLGEQIVLEFARERRMEVVTVRLGYPVVSGSGSALTDAHGDAAICTDDVVAVVSAALTAPVSQACTVVHAQSPVANARYLMSQATELLGYPEGVPA
jgi:nucleoside-diphosphate-sugar epimerase